MSWREYSRIGWSSASRIRMFGLPAASTLLGVVTPEPDGDGEGDREPVQALNRTRRATVASAARRVTCTTNDCTSGPRFGRPSRRARPALRWGANRVLRVY